jgi:hypothetical protein
LAHPIGNPSIRQSVNPSIRQSVNPSIRQSAICNLQSALHFFSVVSARGRIAIAQRLEADIVNKAPFVLALNDARFSKDEYDWVKAHVYAAAGRDLFHLSLQSIVEDPGLTIRVRIVQEHLLDSTPDINRRMVASHLSRIERWRALAFFDL